MKTFDQKTKDKYVARVKAHAEADRIVKGKLWWCPNFLYRKIIKESVELISSL